MGEKRTRAELAKVEILAEAQTLAERDGMDLAMRDLADALNTWPNAIYGHFESKFVLQQALVDHILDGAFTDQVIRATLDEGVPWQERFRTAGLVMFEITSQYRGLGPLIAYHGTGSTSRAMQLIPAMVTLLMKSGLSEKRAATLLQVAVTYITSMGEMDALFKASVTDRSAFLDKFNAGPETPMFETLKAFYDFRKSERVVEGIDIFIRATEAELVE